MATIGLDELPAATRTVLEQGETLDVTKQGEVVARIVPVAPGHIELDATLYQRARERMVDLEHVPPERPLTEQERAKLEADLNAIDALAAEVSAAWQDDMSAVDAVKEQRREL